MNNVTFPSFSWRPAIAEMRPDIAADPMLRIPKPETAAESNVAACAVPARANAAAVAAMAADAAAVTIRSALTCRHLRA